MINYEFVSNECIFIFPPRKLNVAFFFYLVKEYQYQIQSTNTANIVLLSANQIAEIF